MERNGHKKIRLLHGAKFVGSDHDGDGLTQYSKAGEGLLWIKRGNLEVDPEYQVSSHLLGDADRNIVQQSTVGIDMVA